MASQLTLGQRFHARALRRDGKRLAEIAREIGCSVRTARRVTHQDWQSRRTRLAVWSPGPGRLSLVEREEISRAVSAHETVGSIAARLGRAPSTISRELRRNGGRGRYRAIAAHRDAHARARRPKVPRLAGDSALTAVVEAWLGEWWSPQAISRRLRLEYPDDPTMWVSHETIYQALFVQGRGELRRDLQRCLRSGRAQRRHRVGQEHRGTIPDKVMISERPAEVADRAIPGHWEGDLIIGKAGRSAVGTLVERTSRYLMLIHLPEGRAAEKVSDGLRMAAARLPRELMRSLTWDQGKELAGHVSFTVSTGVQVYFCDPHSPWQRGSNENTNGLLRQYLPKGTDLSVYDAEDLARIAASLNNRPRKTLGYLKPSEKFSELVALTA